MCVCPVYIASNYYSTACNFTSLFFLLFIYFHNLILISTKLHSKVFDDHTVYPLHESLAIMTHAKFDQKKKTVLYIHGYVEQPSHQSIHVIVDAYLQRDDYNILVLDWSDLADGNFFVDAVPNIKQVRFVWLCRWGSMPVIYFTAGRISTFM